MFPLDIQSGANDKFSIKLQGTTYQITMTAGSYNSLNDIVNELDKKHVQFHLGDETLIERHAKVEGNIFSVGKMSYKRVVLMPDLYLLDTTKSD